MQTPLLEACFLGHTKIVEFLLNPDDNIKGAIFDRDNNDDTALHYACEFGYLEIVKILLTAYPDNINDEGSYENTPLYIASENGHKEIVELLLQSGALNIKNINGMDAIEVAFSNKHTEIVQLLEKHFQI